MKNTINFIYFLTNFKGEDLNKMIMAAAGGKVFFDHLRSKLDHFVAKDQERTGQRVIRQQPILEWFMELSQGNKIKALEWIDQNYQYKSSYNKRLGNNKWITYDDGTTAVVLSEEEFGELGSDEYESVLGEFKDMNDAMNYADQINKENGVLLS